MDEQNKPINSNEPVSAEEKLLEGTDEGKRLAETEAKAAEYLAGWQRAKADFVNYKKDETQRFEEVARYASEEILKDFILVLDSFDLAVAALEKNGPVEKGVYMIRAQIEDILKKRGLQKIEIKPGEPFDPAVSEAITETESDHPEGSIVDEVETGYKLYGKVLRPARVIISKGKK